MKKIKILILLILISFPLFTFALENNYPGLIGDQTESFLEYMIKITVSLGVITAVLVIIYNGINIIIAQGEVAKIIIAKERIVAVFMGLIILLGIYVLAITVNPDLSIIKLEQLRTFINDTFKWSGNENQNKIEFQEIPLGSIVESILAANSSKRIEDVKDETEELCYTYDENGDTIDRNGDGRITPEGDTLRGVDMFYCIQELNQAIVKKVSALNAGYLCKGENVDGPMRRILKLIESQDEDGKYNCRCSNCANFSYLQVSYACKTITEECEVCDADNNCDIKIRDVCDSKCSCCGSAYYKPNIGCQTSNFFQSKINDPCGQDTRDQIDCARNEIKLRVDGQNYDDMPPGAVANKCSFTALWPDMEYNFLTLDLAIQRMKSFENYYNNHLADLDKAVLMMRNPNGERISLAEFHTLQGQNIQGKEIDSIVFPNINNANYDYNPIKYCKDFNCTLKINKDICLMGERSILTDALYQKELENDPCNNSEGGFCQVYDSETEEYVELKDKRIYSVNEEENKEGFSYNGDGMTFYYKEGFKYEESKNKESFYLETNETEKGYMESLIPLGDVVNNARNFANKLLEFTGEIREEVESTKTKAMEFADLPEKCDCSLNCSTYPTLGGEASCNRTGPEQCPNNSCDDCSTCSANKKEQCICCEECETIELPDESFYLLNYGRIYTNNYLFYNSFWDDFRMKDSYIHYGLEIVDLDANANQGWVRMFGREFEIRMTSSFSGGVYSPRCWDDEVFYIPKDYSNYTFCSNYDPGSKGNCFCVYYPQNIYYATPEDGDCYGLASGISSSELRKGFFKNSYIYNKIVNMEDGMQILEKYFVEVPAVGNYYDSYVGISCKFNPNKVTHVYDMQRNIHMVNYGETLISFYPLKTIPVTICEGEEANNFTDKDKEIIEQANWWKKIKWIEGENAIDLGVTQFNHYTLRSNLPCYDNGGIIIPEQYIARCSPGDLLYYDPSLPDYNPVTDSLEVQSILYLTKKGVSQSADYCPSERGKEINKEYYICPYNDLKDKQCRVFNYKISMEKYNYPEDLKTDVQCTDASTCQSSTDVGYLQKIELLAKRISNYGEGRNLKTEDPNRWKILDILNLSRQKLEKCITGYGYPFKKDMVKNRLLSCEESIDTVVLGIGVIYPDFPYPVSDNKWNCSPFNSSYVELNQQISCRNNKELPACRDAIKNLIDDYYCFYGQ